MTTIERLDEYTTRAVGPRGKRAAMWWLDELISAYRIRFELYPEHNQPDSPWRGGRSSERLYAIEDAQLVAERWCNDGELPTGVHPHGQVAE